MKIRLVHYIWRMAYSCTWLTSGCRVYLDYWRLLYQQEVPCFYGTDSSSTYSQKPNIKLYLEPVQISPDLHSLLSWFTLILNSHLCLSLPHDLCPWSFLIKIVYAFISSCMATCPTPLTFLDLIAVTILGEECQLWSSSCNFLHPPPGFCSQAC